MVPAERSDVAQEVIEHVDAGAAEGLDGRREIDGFQSTMAATTRLQPAVTVGTKRQGNRREINAAPAPV